MSFGLTNAPKMFMTLINSVLCPYLGKFVVVLLDEILINSASKEELELPQAHELYAKENKCKIDTLSWPYHY